ncbi:MAG TPA: universal stress protein [Quisquiliibacterium sp.]|nr:universal stress protein [Quisquiliibacterium sp.]
MTRIGSILLATDFSEDAGHAATRAAMLASEAQASLTLMHVLPAPMLQSLRSMFGNASGAEAGLLDDARQSLSALAAMLAAAAGRAVGEELRVGRVVDEILGASSGFDLLVLGAHGANPLRDLIIGTTAERLLSKLRRPALVIRQPARESYRQVVVAIDFSPDSSAALRTALEVAPNAAITAVHAFDIPFENKLRAAGVPDDEVERHRVQARQSAMQEIERTAVQAGAAPGSIARIVQQGAPGRLLLEHAEHLGADLIVVGKHGQSGVEELLLGSVTRHLLADARCDVLVARHAADGPLP